MVTIPSTLKLTRQQAFAAVAIGLAVAWLQTPTLAAAVGYAIGSIPMAYLLVLAGSRLTGDGAADTADA